jgi:hypothetical protein
VLLFSGFCSSLFFLYDDREVRDTPGQGISRLLLLGEWNATSFNFSAYLFCPLHVCFSFLIDDDYFPSLLLVRIYTGMHVISPFQ